MIKAFITSFKLKNNYRVNSIIYSIKQIPLIKKILPSSLYKSKTLKIIGNIVSGLIEFIGIFVGKLLYILLMIFAIIGLYEDVNTGNTFLHIFTFLTFIGALLNTYMFNPTKDKYYAIVIMNMDASKFTLSNYYYQLLKGVIGFMPFTLIFGLISGVPLAICILLPIFVVMCKVTFGAYILYDFEKTKKARNENLPTKVLWTAIGILLLMAYGLPILKITINSLIFNVIFIISIITGIFSFIKIHRFKDYAKMYKQILTQENVYAVQNKSIQVAKETASKQIEFDNSFSSNKTGFAYFHELFVKRHSKILTKLAKKQAIIILAIIVIVSLVCLFNKNFSEQTNKMILTYLPYFVFIMYILNNGTTVTTAMFMNCDHSMLTYRIYRTPKVILGVFKERLKTLIKINLLPATIIAIGLPTILFITGGTDNPLNYLVLFVAIITMSIFFSVHYLVMYYLLQPYNINTEMKSTTYILVQMGTYFVCYYMLKLRLPIFSFGIAMTAFCFLYTIISLVLIYRLAPKTFKIRG